jgi:hypothetical protein
MSDERRSERLDEETEELEDRGERSERELKEHGDKLEEKIERTRKDWEGKQEDSLVPGAVPEEE